MASLLESLNFEETQQTKKCDGENFLATHTRHWQPRGSTEWRCEICSPPPKPILVGKRRDTSRPDLTTQSRTQPHAQQQPEAEYQSHDLRPMIISHERPTCPHCGCSWTIETYGPDASSRCWSCRKAIDHQSSIKHAPNAATGVDTRRRLLPWGA